MPNTADALINMQVDTTKFKSTHARLFVVFTQGHCDAAALPADNKGLLLASIFFVESTRMKNKVEDSSTEIPQIKATLTAVWNKFKEAATTPAAIKSLESNQNLINKLFQDFDRNGTMHEEIFKNYIAMFDSHSKAVKEVIVEIAESDDPAATAADKEKRKVLLEALKARKDYEIHLVKLAKETTDLQQLGNGKTLEIYVGLPFSAKATTELPNALKAEAQHIHGAKR